jgi:uncharacterized membrane protein
LAIYLTISSVHLGYLRTALLFFLAWGIAFISEFSSTRIGVPYGYYEYLETTRHVELWISNVPFFDSLSYTFMAYASYSTALLASTPIWRRGADVQLVETHRVRQSWSVAVLAVILFVFLDIVVDPVALRGSRWFLGQIYWYPEGGIYFGVPLSNFVGWAIVGSAIIVLLQQFDRFLIRLGWMSERGVRDVRAKALMGPALYYLLLLFNLATTFVIGEPLLGLVGVFIFTPVTVMLVALLFKPANQATAEEFRAHLQDFPTSSLRRRLYYKDSQKKEG